MRRLAALLFAGYVAVLVLAGLGGVIWTRTEMHVLLGVRLDDLTPSAAATLLSQYRFLRAMELGFGAFAVAFRRRIFEDARINSLFLTIMALGILARLLAVGFDGRPKPVMYSFLGYELVSLAVITVSTRRAVRTA
jgi:hypothetical protein